MTIEQPHHHEVEDFEKTISFESGQFAIVDAEVVKGLKGKIPLAEKAVFIPTKQSRDTEFPFKITAVYDDASLRRLVIEPAPADEGPKIAENIQKTGKGGKTSVDRKIGRLSKLGTGLAPKKHERSERNKRYSAKGDQKTKLSSGKSSVEQRMDQKLSIKGAARDNYGQPKSKIDTECVELLAKAKDGMLTESYISSLKYAREIRCALVEARDNFKVAGKSFDLVYGVIQKLDEHWHKSASVWVENIIDKGLLDVG